MKLTYKSTVAACFLGYITQAVSINVAPLLYVTFRDRFGLTLGQIGLLIAVNFATQLTIDALSSRAVVRIGYRPSAVAAHLFVVAGLCGYAVLPFLMPPLAGLLLCAVLCGVGGGLIEVLISPMIEACPTPPDKKSSFMSLLHSFYCWGQAGAILFSTLFFAAFGIDNWRVLVCLWAAVPAVGALLFSFVPVFTLPGDASGSPFRTVFSSRVFWLFALMMLAAGASEMIMSQWASTFAEKGLGVSKTLGDLFGPCAFSLLMGVSRLIYAKFSDRIRLTRMITLSLVLCIASYLLAAYSPVPALGLAGCALCGLSVGVLWPGTFSSAAATGRLADGGMTLFALLAFFGDVGCLSGPAVAGAVADLAGGNLGAAFLFALVFPAAALGAVGVLRRYTKQ